MLQNVLPILDIKVWEFEPFTDGMHVVGMDVDTLMKKHLGHTSFFHPPYITSLRTPEEIWPIWKWGLFLKQFFEHAAEMRSEDTTKLVLVLPVTTLITDSKLSYSLDRHMILLMLRKYAQKVVITQGIACVQFESGNIEHTNDYMPDDASGMYVFVLLSTTPNWVAPQVEVLDFCKKKKESTLLPQALQMEKSMHVRLDMHKAKATNMDMLKTMNGLPCGTRSSIHEGDKEDSLLFKNDNLPVKAPFGLPQGWSAFDFFMAQQSYDLLLGQHDELTRNRVSHALMQATGALLFTHFPQSKEIPRMTADDVRVILRKCNVFMDVCQHVVSWNKFDVLAIVDENCNLSQLAGLFAKGVGTHCTKTGQIM